ncbi:hypothetical protein Tco_0315589 [Tanacetum coccineum]
MGCELLVGCGYGGGRGRRNKAFLHMLCILDGFLDVLEKSVKMVNFLLYLVSGSGRLGLSTQYTPREVDRDEVLGDNGDNSGSRVGVVWMEVGGGIVKARVILLFLCCTLASLEPVHPSEQKGETTSRMYSALCGHSPGWTRHAQRSDWCMKAQGGADRYSGVRVEDTLSYNSTTRQEDKNYITVEDIGRVTLRGRYSHGRGQVRGEGVVVYELDVGGHSAMDKGDIRVGVYMGGVGLGSGQFWGGMGIMVIMIIRNRIWKREESLVNGVCRLTLDVSWGFVGLGGNSVEG